MNARNDLAWLLDVLARRDQRCEDLAVSLDETRASLDAAIAAHDRELREQVAQDIEAHYLGPDAGRNPLTGADSSDALLNWAYDEGLQAAARIARGEEQTDE